MSIPNVEHARLFAERLREARGDKSQAEFARFLGLKNQVTYQRYESGERTPNGVVLYQIARRLGKSVEEMMGEDEPEYVVRETGEPYGGKQGRTLPEVIRELSNMTGLDPEAIRQAIGRLLAGEDQEP